jgi:hypothetical protein
MIKLLASGLVGLLAATYGTVSDIEIIFLCITTFGIIFSLANVKNMWNDKQALLSVPEDERDDLYWAKVELANTAFTAELLRFFMQALLFTLAAFSATIAEPPSQIHLPLKLVLFGTIFRWGLTFVAGALAFTSYLTKKTRRVVQNRLK